MRENLTDLLGPAVTATYGSFYGSVFSTLATLSRATLAELCSALPTLSNADIRLALVTLTQQHIVKHHTDDHGKGRYEPDWENAYNFTCRLPTLHDFMETRYGIEVADVFDAIARAGVITVADLLRELRTDHTDTPLNDHSFQHANVSDDSVTCSGTAESVNLVRQETRLYGALKLLLASGYVIRTHHRQFLAAHDRRGQAVEDLLKSKFTNGIHVKKDREALEEHVQKLLRKWRRDEEQYLHTHISSVASSERKRANPDIEDDDDMAPRQKRLRLEAGLVRAGHEVGHWLEQHTAPIEPGLALSINFEKCAVGLRTEVFKRHCHHRTNATTAQVYAALLQHLEGCLARCHDPLREASPARNPFDERANPVDSNLGLSPPVSTKEVEEHLPLNFNLMPLPPMPDNDVAAGRANANGSAMEAPSNGHDGILATRTPLRYYQIEQHLRQLACDPNGFLQYEGGKWRVPFDSVTQRIIESEVESVIMHTLGRLATRIVRILKFYGHQELKHLASKALATDDTTRQACTLLQQAGWIDVVELPRTARREVTKSLWLWSYDVLKARQKCLAECYFTMARLSIRLQHERQKIERIIDKSERTDVQGYEDKFLSQEEKGTLAKFSRQSEIIIRQIIRMDEIVAIMRDFSAMEYPHKLWDSSWVDWQSLTGEDMEARGLVRDGKADGEEEAE